MNGPIQRLAFVGIVVMGLFVAGGCLGTGENGPSGPTTATETTTAEPGDVSGTVVDPNLEEPIAGATVSLGEQTTDTDESGAFEFTDVSPGEYQLSASRAGYATIERSVAVSGDSSLEVQLKNDKFYEPNASSLGAVHVSGEESCSSCHEADSAMAVNESAPDESCLTCHSEAEVINSTADLEHNPHDDPHGYGEDCGSCHKIHSASVDSCSDCHPDDWIPQPP